MKVSRNRYIRDFMDTRVENPEKNAAEGAGFAGFQDSTEKREVPFWRQNIGIRFWMTWIYFKQSSARVGANFFLFLIEISFLYLWLFIHHQVKAFLLDWRRMKVLCDYNITKSRQLLHLSCSSTLHVQFMQCFFMFLSLFCCWGFWIDL